MSVNDTTTIPTNNVSGDIKANHGIGNNSVGTDNPNVGEKRLAKSPRGNRHKRQCYDHGPADNSGIIPRSQYHHQKTSDDTVIGLRQAVKWSKEFPSLPANTAELMVPYLDKLRLLAELADLEKETVGFSYALHATMKAYIDAFSPGSLVTPKSCSVDMVDAMLKIYKSPAVGTMYYPQQSVETPTGYLDCDQLQLSLKLFESIDDMTQEFVLRLFELLHGSETALMVLGHFLPLNGDDDDDTKLKMLATINEFHEASFAQCEYI